VFAGKGRLHPIDEITGQARVFEVKKGEGFLISPQSINTYVADKENPWSYMWIEFAGLKALSYLQDIGLSRKNPIFYPKDYSSIDDIIKPLKYIVEHPNAPDQALIGHLYLFLNTLLENSTHHRRREGGSLQEFYVREAINYIERNYNKEISVEDIANWCNLNKNYFGKIFKKSMNTTPQDFLIQYRLSKACEMLKFKDLSIKKISEAAGYSNQFYFSRVFKKINKMSPREWRNLNKHVEGQQ